MFWDRTRDNLVLELVHRWQQSEDNAGIQLEEKKESSRFRIGGVGHRILSNVLLCGSGDAIGVINASRTSEQSGEQLRRGGIGRWVHGDVQ